MTMSAVGIAERGRPQRPRLLAGVLAVSVALNLFFVGGALWTRLHASQPATASERFHKLGQSLNLSPPQQAAYDQYVAAILARNNRVRQATEPLLDEAWAEIGKPNPDQIKILQLLDDFSTQRREVMHQTVGATLSFLTTLTPEQKEKFLADEHERRLAARRRRAEEMR
jgi:Spy/CpxP family protein refolding chaperone